MTQPIDILQIAMDQQAEASMRLQRAMARCRDDGDCVPEVDCWHELIMAQRDVQRVRNFMANVFEG